MWHHRSVRKVAEDEIGARGWDKDRKGAVRNCKTFELAGRSATTSEGEVVTWLLDALGVYLRSFLASFMGFRTEMQPVAITMLHAGNLLTRLSSLVYT